MKFATKELAKSYAGKICTGEHDSEVDLEDYGINICRIDDDGSYELL